MRETYKRLRKRLRLESRSTRLPARKLNPSPTSTARTARLNAEQREFRDSRDLGVLDAALPLELWAEHFLAPVYGQKKMPAARRGKELWYLADQVGRVRRGTKPSATPPNRGPC